ncbi:unnamed protein product [Brassica napus]|uniref:(rape) hypothetical protein n=1 Tax=Brassica napus TaxID=3708 RepID=A0A816PB73_BRANA|nr:unnamed protein product [Brassica napus]
MVATSSLIRFLDKQIRNQITSLRGQGGYDKAMEMWFSTRGMPLKFNSYRIEPLRPKTKVNFVACFLMFVRFIKEEIQWKIRSKGTRPRIYHSINMLFSRNTKN